MKRYELPGYYSNKEAANIFNKFNGKTYMNFTVEFGGVAGNNGVVVMTNYDCTEDELRDMFIAYAMSIL